jgi:UDP-2,4-diacetamido-2,4,6-trideoxy-beta-L-altropyranose hydrolase
MTSGPDGTDLVVLIADAGPEAGLGHISRSSAVAVALGCRGVDHRCYAYGADEPLQCDGVPWAPLPGGRPPLTPGGVALVDSYRISQQALERMSESTRLVVMHDHGPAPRGAALVVSPALEEPAEGDGRWLIGLDHAPLRPGFWGLSRRQTTDPVKHVLVTTGGGRFHTLGEEIARTVSDALPAVEVTLVRGPYARSSTELERMQILTAPAAMIGPLLASDLVITSAGQTMLEAAAAGTPCLTLPVVENQRGQAQLLARLGAVRAVDPPRVSDAAAAAIALAGDPDQRRDLSERSQTAVDGYGALRLAFQIERMVHRLGSQRSET